MQQQLQHKVCHSEPSLRVAKRIEKSKFPNFKILLCSMLYSLFSIPVTAQNYQWDWATYGGSDLGDNGWFFKSEQVYDVVVGSDNNYYFLANIGRSSIGSSGSQLAGQPVTVYNNYATSWSDIFLFSTTCDGTVRWSQAIGGGGMVSAYKIALDSNNNVYIGANVQRGTKTGITEYPVHFSPTESLPMPPTNLNTISDAYKLTFLVKYNSNGQFQWKKALQGDVNGITYNNNILYNLLIDSNNNIHFIAGFKEGTFLDGNLIVPATVTGSQHHLIKYDTNGNYISNMQLPMADGSFFVPPSFTFRYDQPRNRYLIAGFRSYLLNDNIPLTYAGTAFTENAYILAIDAANGNEIWRREMTNTEPIFQDNRIYDLVVDDANGDLYIGGKLFQAQQNTVTTIKNSKDPLAKPYTFNIAITGNMPFIAKLDRDGAVQWARTPTGYNNFAANTGMYYGFGLALRNNANEVAFATMGGNTIWDSFSINRPPNHNSDPILMRFNKQTGTVVGMHDIMGSAGNFHMLTAVAVDNDGNYVVGGCYYGNLFTDRPQNQWLGYIGKHDFFVAKLAASTCGTAVSTNKLNKLNVNVYPNPTNDIVNIETPETLQNYEVYNVLGQQIQKGMFNGNNQLNLHGATAGTYFIKVTTTQGSTATVKVIKK